MRLKVSPFWGGKDRTIKRPIWDVLAPSDLANLGIFYHVIIILYSVFLVC